MYHKDPWAHPLHFLLITLLWKMLKETVCNFWCHLAVKSELRTCHRSIFFATHSWFNHQHTYVEKFQTLLKTVLWLIDGSETLLNYWGSLYLWLYDCLTLSLLLEAIFGNYICPDKRTANMRLLTDHTWQTCTNTQSLYLSISEEKMSPKWQTFCRVKNFLLYFQGED